MNERSGEKETGRQQFLTCFAKLHHFTADSTAPCRAAPFNSNQAGLTPCKGIRYTVIPSVTALSQNIVIHWPARYSMFGIKRLSLEVYSCVTTFAEYCRLSGRILFRTSINLQLARLDTSRTVPSEKHEDHELEFTVPFSEIVFGSLCLRSITRTRTGSMMEVSERGR